MHLLTRVEMHSLISMVNASNKSAKVSIQPNIWFFTYFSVSQKSPYIGKINKLIHHLVMVSAYADGWLNSFHVLGLIVAVLWNGLRGPLIFPPLKFYLVGHLKAMVYKEKIRNKDNLKERILNAITSITTDILERVHHESGRRLCVCRKRWRTFFKIL